MFSLLLRCAVDDEDGLAAELSEAGTAGIAEEPEGWRAFFADDALMGAMAARFAAFAPVARRETDVDWERTTRESFPALEIGARFFLVPPWSREATPAGRLRLTIEPGMACGTGWHPCTQLCLEAMETGVVPGGTFLDVGCGSGILSEAARLLGAVGIAACDIDEEAVRVARERIGAPMFVGSVDAVRAGFANAIAANISSEAVEAMTGELARARKPGGVLILSGFRQDEAPALPFAVARRLEREGWLCLIC